VVGSSTWLMLCMIPPPEQYVMAFGMLLVSLVLLRESRKRDEQGPRNKGMQQMHSGGTVVAHHKGLLILLHQYQQIQERRKKTGIALHVCVPCSAAPGSPWTCRGTASTHDLVLGVPMRALHKVLLVLLPQHQSSGGWLTLDMLG